MDISSYEKIAELKAEVERLNSEVLVKTSKILLQAQEGLTAKTREVALQEAAQELCDAWEKLGPRYDGASHIRWLAAPIDKLKRILNDR